MMPFIGYTYKQAEIHHDGMEMAKNIFGQTLHHKNSAFSAGFIYKLPMLVDFQAEIFTNGNIKLRLMREDIPLTPRFRGAFMVDTDKEYMFGLRYILTRNLGISAAYSSHMGLGAGIFLKY